MPVNVIGTLKPKNNGKFPVAEAVDIKVTDDLRLDKALENKADLSTVDFALDQKADKSQTQNLQAQINEIITPVTQDAEVQNARVSSDGTSYTTLKERLDTVDEINQSNFDKITDISDNLFDSTTAADNTKLDGAGGVDEASGYFTSDYIPVLEGMQYYKSIDNSSYLHRVCGYDSTNQWSGFATTDQNFVIPSGTYFIKICGPMADKNTAVVTSITANDVESRNISSQAYNNAEQLKTTIFKTDNNIKISQINDITKKALTNSYARDGFISIAEQAGYDSYYFITNKEYSIWIDTVENSYLSITYGIGFTGSQEVEGVLRLNCSGTIARLRSSESNLPTENNKLTVPRGTAICFTIPHDTDQTVYGFDGDYELSEFFTSKTSEVAVSSLTDITAKKCTAKSTYDETYDSQYADSKGMHESEVYISYGLIIPKDTELYTQSRNNDYFSICVYDDISFTNGVRYRAYAEEDTLPYENSPISLSKNQYIVFTVRKDSRNFEVILSDIEELSSFKSNIPLADTHINQVIESIPNKDCFIKYVEGSGSSHSTERVEVYIPTGKGFVEYEFVHSIRQDYNADVWRVAFAYACDESFNKRYALTANGEWECAVHLLGRPDFSGGVVHGDEVLTDDAIFFVDGAVVDITEYTDFTPFTNLIIVESTELYDPNDSTTIIANHGSEHIFNKDGLKINQSLLWLSDQELTSCYLAMHLPAKTVTDHMYTDNSVIPFEITQYGITFPESKRAIVYGESSGVRSEFEIGNYPVMENGNELLMTDNNGQGYNKCYFVITTDGAVTANTLWKSETKYKFDVNA